MMGRRNADQYMLRFPPGLREQVRQAAEANNRSMNSEIIARVEAAELGEQSARVLELLISIDARLRLIEAHRDDVASPNANMERVEKGEEPKTVDLTVAGVTA